jgi:hypothetical protein
VTDLAAVAPLLLVAAVFVGVCITALRATDWQRRVDRRPQPTEPDVPDGEVLDSARPAPATEPADDVAGDES